MEKRWEMVAQPSQETVDSLHHAINVNKAIAAVLVQRGVTTFDEAHRFFRPSLDQLHDPFLMKDMDKAVNRLSTAIANNEKIVIYGDYDVDGTTSVALVYGFLSSFYPHIAYYIPDRYKEGYGISEQGVQWAGDHGYSLMIALDCGVKAITKIAMANQQGVDAIICDHHLPGHILPSAYAILDPKRSDCQYPFKELSGCGVGFKLLQGFCLQNDIEEKKLYQYLDLVAVSIASDIVPIVDENRVLAYFGLKKINKKPLPGLKAIIENCGYKNEIDISSVVFGIGPRINATGRISHAHDSVKLLLSKSVEEAKGFALEVEGKNTERKEFDHQITQEAMELIAAEQEADKRSTVLFKPDWHKGVIGIVASRCIDRYYKPTIILTQSNERATGSARSVTGFDIYSAIEQCADLLEQYGGHQFAAGLTMRLENVAAFQARFEEVVARTILPEQMTPHILIDQELHFSHISQRFYNIIKQMAPFGPHNMTPVFCTHKVKVVNTPRLLKEEHLKLQLKQEGSDKVVDVIGFGFGAYYDMVASGMEFSIAYTVEENNYMDRTSIQLNLKDIRFE